MTSHLRPLACVLARIRSSGGDRDQGQNRGIGIDLGRETLPTLPIQVDVHSDDVLHVGQGARKLGLVYEGPLEGGALDAPEPVLLPGDLEWYSARGQSVTIVCLL
jgi:hypothetical protein